MTPEDTISQNWNSYRANDPIQMKKKKQTMGVRGSYYRLVDLKKELHKRASCGPSEAYLLLYSVSGGGLVTKLCLTLMTPWTVSARLLCPWDSPGKNTGVGCHFLLQGIFPTQESNPGLLHCRQILYQLSYEGSPNPNPNPTLLVPNLKEQFLILWRLK